MVENLARVVTKENVIKALDEVIASNEELIESTKFDILYKGKRFPPKEIVRKAAKLQNIRDWWTYRLSGGESTNKPLRDKGFEIVHKGEMVDPIKLLVEQYKQRIKRTRLQDELYKWELLKQFKGRPNIDASNFTEEILNINFSNLVYPVGIAVIKHIAKEKPEDYRACFRILFDDNIGLNERLTRLSDEVLKVYRSAGEEKFWHHHDERTCATLLAYHKPDRYAFYKDSFYQKYCKLCGENPKKKGEKYEHYLSLIQDFIEDYIIEDSELLNLVSGILHANCYQDPKHLLLAQDILYQMLDKPENNVKRYWRIGTKDPDESYWDTMQENNYISIGWGELGDLSELELNDKKPIENKMRELGFYKKNGEFDNRTISRKSGEIFNFVKSIQEGDIVLAQDGATILGIGVVSDDYDYDGNETFAHIRPVKWKVLYPDKFFSEEGNQTTVYQITNSNTIARIEKLLNEAKPMNNISIHSKNIILYGPPGTGKTYNCIDLAVKIADGYSLDTHSRNKSRFDQLKKEGRIEFITFHQNYSYEDFVVGLKPDVEFEQLRFKPHKGVFYEIARKAKDNYLASLESRSIAKDFEAVFNEIIQPTTEGKDVEIKMKSGISFWIYDTTSTSILFRKKDGSTIHTLSIDTLKDLVYNRRQMPSGLEPYYAPLIALIKEKQVQSNDTPIEAQKNYVLVIDEINRANISRVFGELITLLEDDKRMGEPNELRVTLPNKEEDFSIPPNLYIIGTMNTADKSIALVDIALRRRFEFIGYYPDYTIPELDAEKADLLKQINKIIYKKKNSADYLIGHAYFLNNTTIETIIEKKVIPLLLEYFSGKTDIVSDVFAETTWSVKYNEETYSWIIQNDRS